MKRHALPQNIMDIEFKLFGAFTLNQFINLAVNVVIALVIYTTPLPVVIKWPIITFFVILGLALAMVTVNGLPFSSWLGNFVLALTTSQRRVWKKTPKTPEALRGRPETKSTGYNTELVSNSKKNIDMDMPLLTEEVKQTAVKIDQEESKQLAAIDSHLLHNYKKSDFQIKEKSPQNIPTEKPLSSPIVNLKEQRLAMDTRLNNPNQIGIQTGDNTAAVINMDNKIKANRQVDISAFMDEVPLENAVPGQDIPPESTAPQAQKSIPSVTKDESINANNAKTSIENQPNVIEKKVEPRLVDRNISTVEGATSQGNNFEEINQLQKQIYDLQSQLRHFQTENNEDVVKQSDIAKKIDDLTGQYKTITSDEQQKSDAVQILPVNKPNIVSGYIIDRNGNPINEVSIEIKDKQGFPLRKTVSDKRGYFIFPTPLQNGDYILDFEKPGRTFIDYNINLNGKILPTYKFQEK